ncbi:MAG: DciA family protein [Cyanobacteria bacterium P01_H01_bin.74]
MTKRYQEKKKKSIKRKGSMAVLSEVLPKVCEAVALDKKVNELAFLALWPGQATKLIGEHAVQYTRAVRVYHKAGKNTLLVMVANASLASELSFFLPALQAGLNAFSPQTQITIDQIQLQVGL